MLFHKFHDSHQSKHNNFVSTTLLTTSSIKQTLFYPQDFVIVGFMKAPSTFQTTVTAEVV